ncbi:hypothetical protein T492DRAFT_971111 [Pavlovales sp. CCMP2436]|nr:hypothetical protein T492DRAFT_971111 [Pavlovales sp. CCMP2436]
MVAWLVLSGRLLPPSLSWQGHTLHSAEAWRAILNALESTEAWRRLGQNRRGYFNCLASAAKPSSCCVPDRAGALAAKPELDVEIL